MNAIDRGFVTLGTEVSAQGATGPIVLKPSASQSLRIIEIEYATGEVWNEAVGENGITSGVAEMQAIFSGSNTIAGHVNTLLATLGIKPNATEQTIINTASGVANTILGNVKVTSTDALTVAGSILSQAGIIPSTLAALLPTVETAATTLLAKIKAAL